MKHDHHPWKARSMCEGKDKLTVGKAKSIARKMRKDGKRVGAYRCELCHEWHVGRNLK